MLRVELHDSVLKLEGRLTAVDAEHIRALMTRCDAPSKIKVDITEVSFVDSVGEALLSFLGRDGAEFVADTAYSLDVCERLDLRVARNGISQTKHSAMRKPRTSPLS